MLFWYSGVVPECSVFAYRGLAMTGLACKANHASVGYLIRYQDRFSRHYPVHFPATSSTSRWDTSLEHHNAVLESFARGAEGHPGQRFMAHKAEHALRLLHATPGGISSGKRSQKRWMECGRAVRKLTLPPGTGAQATSTDRERSQRSS